jgi:hypothetical protein
MTKIEPNSLWKRRAKQFSEMVYVVESDNGEVIFYRMQHSNITLPPFPKSMFLADFEPAYEN